MIFPIGCLEVATHNFSLLAPDSAFSVGAANDILLKVDRTEQSVAGDTNGENQRRHWGRELDWIACEILRLERIHGRQPDGRSPGKVEAEVVVANVDSAEIPDLIRAKLAVIQEKTLTSSH